MIPPYKLSKLHPRQRLRKSALLFEECERILAAPGSPPDGSALDPGAACQYASSLAAWLGADPDFPEPLRPLALDAAALLAALVHPGQEPVFPLDAGSPALRSLNRLRHALLRESGQAPADWDLLAPVPGAAPGSFTSSDPAQLRSRRVFPGMRAYLEDIRSPFNIGGMFRSADAFGLEELILSPESADPHHPRAERSSMGALDLVPWRRLGLETVLDEYGSEAFALELGGTPLSEFEFPEAGLVIVGSEELGVSAEARARCGLGLVSIPMYGAKGSLNAGVAFGILLNAWATQLAARMP